MLQKSVLRINLLRRRKMISFFKKRVADFIICQRLLNWLIIYLRAHNITVLGVYTPISSEPNLYSVYNTLRAYGLKLCLPVVGSNNVLYFVNWMPNDTLIRDIHGSFFPSHGNTITKFPDVVIMPCIGFNAENIRLGYGGGYYDRTFNRLSKSQKPITIGVSYIDAKVMFVSEIHDLILDVIITN